VILFNTLESRDERIHEDPACAMPTSSSSSRLHPVYPSRERFLTELTLDPPSSKGQMEIGSRPERR